MNNPLLVGHLTTGRTGPLQGHRPPDRNKEIHAEGTTFKELLSRQQLKFSHHAEQRLEQRGIRLQPDQIERIASAVEQAAAKGAKDSLVLYRDIAMIVSVPNRTVVTAMDGPSIKEHIFTQIDSAVVVS
ncbi:TIGR02530 family flagellar biosynthesis protein [Cohnella hongkongensis]|uniref:TIGR02530 family flagellar biosynthesis protein n=1 Tax=Cohnella hongkongensis TaxID=178337 RepID=A0ABV9FD68_9BACL